MSPGRLADLVVLAHLAFIAFAAAGGLLVLRRRWVAALHLPALVWAVVIELSGGECPLTPLEQRLRRAAGEEGYAGSFVDHYLAPVVYPPGLARGHQLALGAGLAAANAALYARAWRRRRRVIA